MNNHSYNIIVLRRITFMYANDKVIEMMENTLKLAGDSTRLKILFCLLSELDNSETDSSHFVEKCVNDIALQIGSSQSLVSHQLKVLKDGDFVKSRKEGTKIYYSLKDEHVRQIMHVTYEHVLEDYVNE